MRALRKFRLGPTPLVQAHSLQKKLGFPVYLKLGSEFMPPLDEGAILYMPSTMPGISIGEAQRVLQITDRILKKFPEVDRVLGKAGRAETSTDPAPRSCSPRCRTPPPPHSG